MNDTVKVALGFGIAGLVGGAVSGGGTFLGLGVFGALCGIVLGLLARNRRIVFVGAGLGAVSFMAGGALAFVIGMAAGSAFGAPDWYDTLLPAFMGACAGIVGGFGMVAVNRDAGRTWRSAVGLALGFALAALVSQTWLMSALTEPALQNLVPMALWGVLGGIGFSLLNRAPR
jgi:hypothetical protein